MLAWVLAITVEAQPGANDPTFNPLDIGFGHGDGFGSAWVNDHVIQADGKVIAIGEFRQFDGQLSPCIARLNLDGTYDPSYDVSSGFTSAPSTMALQPDGKAIVGGVFTTYRGSVVNRIVRIRADGTRDGSFQTYPGANDMVDAIAIQPDGKILVGGTFTSFGGSPRNRIARLNSNGTLDPTFVVGQGFSPGNYASVDELRIQSDGKILVGGRFTDYDGITRADVVRLNPDGSLDTTFFFTSAIEFGYVHAMELMSDGRIYVQEANVLKRLNPDGSVDVTFPISAQFNGTIWDLTIQPDGKLLVAGHFDEFDGEPMNNLARLNVDGTLDGTFAVGNGANNYVAAVRVRSDGKVVISGRFRSFDGMGRKHMAQLNADGSVDPTFMVPGTGFNEEVLAMARQDDGKIIAVGAFTSYNGTGANCIARLNADGDLDGSFDVGTGCSYSSDANVSCVAIQPDGKILIGGQFTEFNGQSRNHIARLNPDGSLDPTFSVGTGFMKYGQNELAPPGIAQVSVLGDGRILVAGWFGQYNSAVCNSMARLNSDGSLDPTFNTGAGAVGVNETPSDFVVQPNGKMVIVGSFESFNGVPRNNIARLNTDGSVDPLFNPGLGSSDPINTIVRQPNGQHIIGGRFSSYNGMACGGIARVNATGGFDGTFYTGSGFGGAQAEVSTLVLRADGDVWVGGRFITYNGVDRPRIARLNTDGSLDTGFDPGSGFSGLTAHPTDPGVDDLIVLPDSRLLVCGNFTSYQGTGRNRIARVIDECIIGAPCDDGVGLSINDVVNADCICQGTYPCQSTQLTTTADPVISCGAVNLKLNGTSTIAATEVPGANKYQFRFTNTPGQPAYARTIAFPTRSFTLTPWYTKPLKAGRTYNVQVHASFDNGATWCDYGPSCTVKISWTPLAPFAEPRGYEAAYTEEPMELLLYPNPTNGDQVRIQLSGIDPELTIATLDITDLFGKRVMSTALPLQDGALNTSLALPGTMAGGLYVVTIVTGEHLFTERFVVDR